jgi:hypothetical protein
MPRETLRISYLCLNLVRAMPQSWQVCTACSYAALRQTFLTQLRRRAEISTPARAMGYAFRMLAVAALGHGLGLASLSFCDAVFDHKCHSYYL